MTEPLPRRSTALTVRDAWWAVWVAGLLFAGGIAVGYAKPEAMGLFMEQIEEIVETLRGRSPATMALIIFLRNGIAATFAILLGPIVGIVPAYGAVINGMLVGAILVEEPAALWAILPHGVIEVPAMWLAWGLGIWCGAAVVRRDASVGDRLRRSLRAFFRLVIPLLAVAAVIEAAAIAAAMAGAG